MADHEHPLQEIALGFRHTRNDDFVVTPDGNGGEELLTPYDVEPGTWPTRLGDPVVRRAPKPVVDGE